MFYCPERSEKIFFPLAAHHQDGFCAIALDFEQHCVALGEPKGVISSRVCGSSGFAFRQEKGNSLRSTMLFRRAFRTFQGDLAAPAFFGGRREMKQ